MSILAASLPSYATRQDYRRDLEQFLAHLGCGKDALEALPKVRPLHVAAWRDHLKEQGLLGRPLTRRAVQRLVGRWVRKVRLDPSVTVHSLRVTVLTTAPERGSDIIDLQDFAGHAASRTTLTYIRSRDRLSKSPAYVLKY